MSLDFSAASMRMMKISSAVRNISIKTPWAIEVPGDKVVLTIAISPGNMQETSAAATIAPRIWAGKRNNPRIHGSLPAVHKPSVTYTQT